MWKNLVIAAPGDRVIAFCSKSKRGVYDIASLHFFFCLYVHKINQYDEKNYFDFVTDMLSIEMRSCLFFASIYKTKNRFDVICCVIPFVKIDLDNLIKVFRKFLKSQLWQNFVRINEKNARYIIIDALSHIVFVFYLINTFLKLLHKQCLLSSNNLLILFPYYKMLCFDLISS